jgi:large subunit ribosomal protein L3
MLGLIGKKMGMTRLFSQDGTAVPVTVIQAGPCKVTQVKTSETDGYEAVQVGFGSRKEKNINRAVKGHLAKVPGFMPVRLREFRIPSAGEYSVGQEMDVTLFQEGEKVDVIGVMKGRGFQGVMKRHHFNGGRATHGNTAHRVPGSVGASADPSRTWKNLRLPGQMGNARRTQKNLQVVRVDAERGILFIRGAVPGPANGLVTVRKQK